MTILEGVLSELYSGTVQATVYRQPHWECGCPHFCPVSKLTEDEQAQNTSAAISVAKALWLAA